MRDLTGLATLRLLTLAGIEGLEVTPRNATVSVAQNNSSEAADSQHSDLTSELRVAFSPVSPPPQADISHHRPRLFSRFLTGKGILEDSAHLVCLMNHHTECPAGYLKMLVCLFM